MDNSIPRVRPGMVSVQTAPRPTAAPTRVQFSEVLAGGARALVRGAQAALRSLPGSPWMAAAIRGGGSGLPSAMAIEGALPGGASVLGNPEGPGGVAPGALGGGTAGGPGDGTIEGTLAQQQEMNLYYLQIQEEVNAQNRTFSALSNVLEVEHNTAKTAIGNIH
jgi:hypothetical protein